LDVRVVVVDDEADIRLLLGMTLPLAGIEVVGEAADGWAGLAEVGRSEPDAVVLDVRMPGLDGWDTLRQLHEAYPSTPVVLYTADPEPGLSARAAEFGATVVGKADKPGRLVEAILHGHS
jgi:CheY-like chemotaxis protein